jgi:hypothetical protein
VKRFVAPESGRYFVIARTAAAFTGTVRFDLKVKAQRVFRGSSVAGDVVTAAPAVAATPPGSYFTVRAKRSKGSFVTPLIGNPRDGLDLLETALGTSKSSSKAASYKHPDPVENTRLTVGLDNLPGTEGSLDWTIILKIPKSYFVEFPDLATGAVIEPE